MVFTQVIGVTKPITLSYNNNNVVGNSSYIYGIYVSGNNETLIGNEITLVGNFTTGVASSASTVTLNKNDIITNGNNIGNASKCGDSIIAETTGVKIAYGNATVTNCTVKTTGQLRKVLWSEHTRHIIFCCIRQRHTTQPDT